MVSLVLWQRHGFILIKRVFRRFASDMNLLFYADFITSSNLRLQLFSEPLLSEFLLATGIGLSECLWTRQLAMMVVRLGHVRAGLDTQRRTVLLGVHYLQIE